MATLQSSWQMSIVIKRPGHLRTLERLLARSPVVALLGARQAGKTTLAPILVRRLGHTTTIFDLERAKDLARLEDPELGTDLRSSAPPRPEPRDR